MFRIFLRSRNFCKAAKQNEEFLSQIRFTEKQRKQINYKELRHITKVPTDPVIQEYPTHNQSGVASIDTKTIQLLERLALVDLDSKAALETLKSSIQFADKILHINTDGIEPLYTVLENENLYLREDKVIEGDNRDSVLKNAKVVEEDYYVSPPGNIPLEQEEKNL